MPSSNKRKHVPEYNKSCSVIKHTVNWCGPLQSSPGISPPLPASLSVLESLPAVVLLLRCCVVTSLRDIKPIIKTLAYKDKRVREDFLSFKTETKMTGNAHTNVTLRSGHVTTVASKSNKYYIFWVRVCSLSYAAYYIVTSGLSVWLHHISPHYLTNIMIFE